MECLECASVSNPVYVVSNIYDYAMKPQERLPLDHVLFTNHYGSLWSGHNYTIHEGGCCSRDDLLPLNS